MDTEADAYASCPRYEAPSPVVSPCRCPCPGCVYHCSAHQEAPGYDEADRRADETAREAYAEQGEAEGFLTADNGLEGCGVCTQFTPCPNPGIGCFVNPPGARVAFDDTPLEVVRLEALVPVACPYCDDSDEEFCGLHDDRRPDRGFTCSGPCTYACGSADLGHPCT